MRIVSLAGLLAALAAAAPASSQEHPFVEFAERHPLIPVAQLGFVGDPAPALTAGGRWIYRPTPRPKRDPVTGLIPPVKSTWFTEVLATGGVTFAEGDPVGFTGVGSVGVMRPLATGPLIGAGVVALGSLHPDALGPAIRVETSFHALAGQAGVVWFREGGPRAALTVDVASSLVCDLRGCRRGAALPAVPPST